MSDAFHDVHRVAKDRGVTLRTAAYVLAVERVARAESHRGFAG
jgi:glutamate dehydrogenase/leucine dehydrogenase